MLPRRLCPNFTPCIKWTQADHTIDIGHGARICLNLFNTRDKIRTQNPTKLNRLNYKMLYKSVIIHKNRIFPYFQNKVKNLKNIIIILMIIVVRKIIRKKANKKKRYITVIK